MLSRQSPRLKEREVAAAVIVGIGGTIVDVQAEIVQNGAQRYIRDGILLLANEWVNNAQFHAISEVISERLASTLWTIETVLSSLIARRNSIEIADNTSNSRPT